jgi:peptide/nickel transport system permease protein
MFKSIAVSAAFLVLGILLVVSLFPQLFSSRDAKQTLLTVLPPNDGINKLVVFNSPGSGFCTREKNETVIIDSIVLSINKQRQKVSGKMIIPFDQYRNVSFLVDKTPNEQIRNIKLLFYSSDKDNAKYVKFAINNQEPEQQDYYMLQSMTGNCGSYYSPSFCSNCKMSKKTLKNRLAIKAILGTDSNQYDVWARLVYGTRIIMMIVLFSSVISLILGSSLGMMRGYYNNFFTQIINIVSEMFSSMSLYVIAILINLFFGKDVIVMILAFALLQWVEIEKNVAMKVKGIVKEDFIKASKMVGKSDFTLLKEDILPIIAPEILIGFFYLAKRIIVIEASLSFIRYSVELPYTSWGNIISEAKSSMLTVDALQFVIPPVIAIVVTSLSFNILEIYFRDKFRS